MTQYKRPVRPGQPQQRPAPRPAQPTRRPAPAARPQATRGSGMKYALPHDFWMLLVIGAVVVALGITAQKLWPAGFPVQVSQTVQTATLVSEIHGSGPVRINEVMSSNSATLMDGQGLSADWIEITNVSRGPVDLSGYGLAKTEKATNVFTFPQHVLQSGESVIVFADSTLRSVAGEEYHAPFRLSSQGGTLMLFNPSGSAIDSVNFPAMESDVSYIREGQSKWATSSKPTPGLSNTEESYRMLHEVQANAGVVITEVVSSNTKYAPDENGLFQDYFELHNTTGAPVDLSGFFVSDSVEAPAQWRLPEGFVLQPGEYRIVYASGLNRADAQYPHANFGLSSEGEAVVLADSMGRVQDQVVFDLLKTDVAWARQADGSWTTAVPTPGSAN